MGALELCRVPSNKERLCPQSQEAGSDSWGGPDLPPHTASLEAPFPRATGSPQALLLPPYPGG